MEAILSLGIKNNLIRNDIFVPAIDFRLLTFGFINYSYTLDRSGTLDKIRREQYGAAEQIEEQKPIIQAPSSSGLSLEKRLMPNGIGALEQAAYYSGRKIHEAQFIFPSYLFFDLQPRHLLFDANQRYPLYAYLALRKSFHYIGRYKTIASATEYFAEAPYEAAESSKSYLPMAYSLTVVLFSPFDSKKENYARAELFARPKVSADFVYVNYAQSTSTYAQALPSVEAKATELTAPVQLLTIDALFDQQLDSTQQKPEVRIYTNRIPKISYQVQEIKSPLKNLATLDTNVRSIYRLQITTRDQIYNAHQHSPMLPSHPNNPKEKTQTSEPRIESRVIAFFIDRTYQELVTRETYGQNTNYDMPSGWINIMGSNFWRSKSSLYIGKAKYTKSREQLSGLREEDTKNKSIKRIEDESEIKEKPIYEKEAKQRTDDEALAEKSPRPEYEANKANQTYNSEVQSEKGVKSNKDNKKPKAKGRSILSYLGVAAGVGLLGLATLASPLLDRTKETERSSIYAVSNNKTTEESQKFTNPTIDSVVAPSTENNLIFTPEFKEDIESIISRTYQMGYEDASISIRNNKTGEHYSFGNIKTPKPMPSSVKVAIGFAASYLAQKRLLDLGKKIEFDPDADKELVLQRELEEYTQFKNKNNFDYDELRRLMLRDSVNTATNLILKFIGNGNVYEGMRRVNQVMGEVGLNNTRVEVPYNRITEYTRNQATTEENEKLMSYILQCKHLRAEDLASLREDLENERWMYAFRSMLPGVNSGTKVTIYKNGIGFAAYLGDYSVSAMFNHSKEELYTDLARSAAHIFQNAQVTNPEERITNQIYADSNIAIGDLFKTFRKYLFSQPPKKFT